MQTTKKIDNSLPSIGIIFNKFIQKYNILDIIPYLIFYIKTIYTQIYFIIAHIQKKASPAPCKAKGQGLLYVLKNCRKEAAYSPTALLVSMVHTSFAKEALPMWGGCSPKRRTFVWAASSGVQVGIPPPLGLPVLAKLVR